LNVDNIRLVNNQLVVSVALRKGLVSVRPGYCPRVGILLPDSAVLRADDSLAVSGDLELIRARVLKGELLIVGAYDYDGYGLGPGDSSDVVSVEIV
jgi:hypothetical protein